MSLSEEERRRIYEEEKTHEASRKKYKAVG